MIRAEYWPGRPISEAGLKSLKRMAERSMAASGSVTSRSGATAAFAINWCEENGKRYQMECMPGVGYHVVIVGGRS